MTDMFLDSLKNRVRAVNVLWQLAVADLTLAHVNHHERAGVLPIAFSLHHVIRGQDHWVSRLFLDEPSAWDSGGWSARVGATVGKLGGGEAVAEMEALRFADLDAWRAYQTEVVARTERALASLTADVLAEVVIPSFQPQMVNTFCGYVVGIGNPLRKLEVLECFIFQHASRHLGELEHARALVGLAGLTH